MNDALDQIKLSLVDAASRRVRQRRQRARRLRLAAVGAATLAVSGGIATATIVETHPFGWFREAPPAGPPAADPEHLRVEDGAGGAWVLDSYLSKQGLACVAIDHLPSRAGQESRLSCRNGLALIGGFDLDGPLSGGFARSGRAWVMYGFVPSSATGVALALPDGRTITATVDNGPLLRVPVRPSSRPTAAEQALLAEYPRVLTLQRFVIVWTTAAGTDMTGPVVARVMQPGNRVALVRLTIPSSL